MIESIKMLSIIVYIDHSATILILRQITFIMFNTNKLNLKFIRTSQYVFDFNFFIRHKIDKFNVIFDVLFKLQVDVTFIKKIDVLKLLYDFLIELYQGDLIIKSIDSLSKQLVCYHIILIKMTNELKKRLKTIYNKNLH